MSNTKVANLQIRNSDEFCEELSNEELSIITGGFTVVNGQKYNIITPNDSFNLSSEEELQIRRGEVKEVYTDADGNITIDGQAFKFDVTVDD